MQQENKTLPLGRNEPTTRLHAVISEGRAVHMQQSLVVALTNPHRCARLLVIAFNRPVHEGVQPVHKNRAPIFLEPHFFVCF
jgi:hypothetical protein